MTHGARGGPGVDGRRYAVHLRERDALQHLAALVVGETEPGEAFWYLARHVSGDGNGTYDTGAASQVESRDDEIAASGVECP